jgi:vacuolar-type H+-ATPase subunit C/Vma6
MVLPKKDSGDIQKILSEEIALRNAVLALRMRRYYSMPPKEIREKFITIKEHDKAHRFTGPAEASLALPLDQRADWTHWKWYRFLNPENPQEPWRADPRYFQNAAAEYLYRLARYSFRRSAFSLDSIFCFIKLKLFEEDLLTSVAEGLGLGISSRDVFSLLEVES